MNSTALSPLSNPGASFATTLSDLNSALTQFAPLVNPIDALTAIVAEVDSLLEGVSDLISGLSDIDTLIGLLAEVLEFLTPIPIIGDVVELIVAGVEAGVETIQGVVDTAQGLNTDVIQPVVTVLKDMASGLGDIRDLVVEIGQTVPGYINTVEILSYLSEIAAPVSQVLVKGPAQQLSDLLEEFNTVQTDVGTAISALDPAITAIAAAVGAVTKELTAITNGIGTAGQDALKVVQAVLSVAQPIYDGFQRVENAITPLKWVLDALKCVFNTILAPVIDAILTVTGLKALAKNAAEELFAKIGLTPVLNQIGGSVDTGSVKAGGSSVGAEKGAAAQSLWAALQTGLGQYRSGDSATSAAIDSVISAITGTAIAPDSVGIPPPFPPPTPRLNGNGGTPGATSGLGSTARYIPRRIPRFDSAALTRLQTTRAAPAPRSMKAMLAATGQPNPLNRVDPTDWPQTAALIADIDQLVQALDALSPQAANLQSALAGMDAALALPTTFGQQVTLMGQLLGSAVTILDFVGTVKMPILQSLVAPLDTIAHDQNAALGQVSAAVPALQAAVTTLTPSVQQVIAAIPSGRDISETLSRIEGWSMSATQLVTFVRQARLKDSAKGNANAAAIDTLAAQIESAAADLGARVAILASQTTAQSQGVAAVQVAVTGFASALQTVSDHSQILADSALPAADKAAHVLGIIDSIVDPLSGLMQMEGCIDGGAAMKTFGAAAVSVMSNIGQTAMTPPPQTFAGFATALADQALPLGEMATAVAAATTTINSQTVATFAAQATALAAALTALDQALVATKTYSTTIPDPKGTGMIPITEANDLVDGVLLAQAQSIISALGLSLPPAASHP